MAYCRASNTCNVYMYHSVMGGYQFYLAPTRLHPEPQDFFIVDASEALRKLKRLQAQGYGVPDYAIERLESEINSED